jgi:hypothetical protein
MIWFFGKGDEVVRLETRFEQVTNEYVLVTSWAQKPDETERFRDFAAFDLRIHALERQLQDARWTLIGQPTLLKDGWKGP